MIQTLIIHTANADVMDAEQIITVMVLSAKETRNTMVRKKPMWVRNDIVYDPNIDYPSVFDIEYEDVEENKTQYHAGKGKKKRYTGV